MDTSCDMHPKMKVEKVANAVHVGCWQPWDLKRQTWINRSQETDSLSRAAHLVLTVSFELFVEAPKSESR